MKGLITMTNNKDREIIQLMFNELFEYLNARIEQEEYFKNKFKNEADKSKWLRHSTLLYDLESLRFTIVMHYELFRDKIYTIGDNNDDNI